MRAILLLFLTVVACNWVHAQNEIKQAKNRVPLERIDLNPPNIASKVYFYQGEYILVYRSYRSYCPSGAPYCEHGHMPVRELTYTSREGLNLLWQWGSWSQIPEPPEKWKGLADLIKEDEEFGPAAKGL